MFCICTETNWVLLKCEVFLIITCDLLFQIENGHKCKFIFYEMPWLQLIYIFFFFGSSKFRGNTAVLIQMDQVNFVGVQLC